jgi:hypothetical protein
VRKGTGRACGEDPARVLGKVKTDRGKIQQGYIDELTQWIILGNYVAVKVRADRARSIGLYYSRGFTLSCR